MKLETERQGQSYSYRTKSGFRRKPDSVEGVGKYRPCALLEAASAGWLRYCDTTIIHGEKP